MKSIKNDNSIHQQSVQKQQQNTTLWRDDRKNVHALFFFQLQITLIQFDLDNSVKCCARVTFFPARFVVEFGFLIENSIK